MGFPCEPPQLRAGPPAVVSAWERGSTGTARLHIKVVAVVQRPMAPANGDLALGRQYKRPANPWAGPVRRYTRARFSRREGQPRVRASLALRGCRRRGVAGRGDLLRPTGVEGGAPGGGSARASSLRACDKSDRSPVPGSLPIVGHKSDVVAQVKHCDQGVRPLYRPSALGIHAWTCPYRHCTRSVQRYFHVRQGATHMRWRGTNRT